MTLFLDVSVGRPDHIVFPTDLAPREAELSEQNRPQDVGDKDQNNAGHDLSLAGSVERHIRFVFSQTNQNQRRAAKLLGISRTTLARHLRAMNRG